MSSTLTNLVYHVVFSTKQREPLIHPSFVERIHGYMGGIIRQNKGHLLRIGGVTDHVHLVVKLKPDISLSDLIRITKANTSKWLNELDDYPGHFEWQRGYAAFSVSQSQLPSLFAYVDNQIEHHRVKSFQVEHVPPLRG